LPAWLRSSVTNYTNFGLALREMAAFFKNAEKSVPDILIQLALLIVRTFLTINRAKDNGENLHFVIEMSAMF